MTESNKSQEPDDDWKKYCTLITQAEYDAIDAEEIT